MTRKTRTYISLTEATDELHIGNRWLGHSGLAMYDNTARMHDPLLMRFVSPDPLYSKYGPLSPYAHCAANPLNLIDPDGRDNYTMNTDGSFVKTQDTDDNYHEIKNETNNATIKVELNFFATSKSQAGIDGTLKYILNLYHLSSEGTTEFEFFAKNSDVEWSILKFNDGSSVIGTSHLKDADATPGYYLEMNSGTLHNLKEFVHSHPQYSGPGRADVKMAEKLESYNKAVECSVFATDESVYIPYNSKTDWSTFNEIKVTAPRKKLLVPVNIKIPIHLKH